MDVLWAELELNMNQMKLLSANWNERELNETWKELIETNGANWS